MAKNTLSDYFSALERLVKGTSIRVPKFTLITNDAVSLEAGRKKGSIKKSRPEFSELILAIREAATIQENKKLERSSGASDSAREDELTNLLDAALAREISLIREVFKLRKELAKITGENILPFRRFSISKQMDNGSE